MQLMPRLEERNIVDCIITEGTDPQRPGPISQEKWRPGLAFDAEG